MLKQNFITFPVYTNKTPKVGEWQKLTKSHKSTKYWGVLCGEINNLLVVDIDVDDNGIKAWGELIAKHPKFETTIVKTKSGGFHYYFKHRDGLKNSVKVNGVGIDVRTTGGYVVGFGSKGYELLNDVLPTDIPEWLFQYIKPKSKSKKSESIDECKYSDKALDLYNSVDDSKNHGSIKQITTTDNNTLLSLKRNCSSHCEFCDKIHDRDNTALLLICEEDNKIMYGCTKSNSMKFLGHITDEELKEKPEIKKKTTKDIIKGIIAEDLKKKIKHTNFLFGLIGLFTIFKEQYCSNNDDLIQCKSPIVAIKSGTGTGKTNAVAKILNGTKNRVLITTFRVGQVEQLRSDKFKNLKNIVSYSDKIDNKKIKIDNSQTEVICQIESIHRVKWTNFKKNKTTLVFDEIEQIKKQFTSETFMKQPTNKKSFKTFKQLVKNASQIFLMDAHLTPATIKWIQEIRCNDCKDSTAIFLNTYQKQNKAEIQLADSPYTILDDMVGKLKDNKKVYVACNGSIEKINAYAEVMRRSRGEQEQPLNILVIHRETLHTEKVHKAISNLNQEWGKYDGIIVSPSIQSGLSYDMPDVFDSVYGIFGNYTSSSPDCIQMLDRIRHPISPQIKVSINMGNNNIGPTTEKQIIESFKSKTSHLFKSTVQMETMVDYEIDDNGYNTFKKNDYFQLYIDNLINANTNKQFFLCEFLRAEREAGFKLTALKEMDKKLITAYKKKIKAIIEVHKDENAKSIAQVISVSDAEIKAIKNKLQQGDEVSEVEVLNLKKNVILKTYDVNEYDMSELKTDEKNEWFKNYGDKKVRKIFTSQRRVFSKPTYDELLITMREAERNNNNNKMKSINGDLEDRYDEDILNPMDKNDKDYSICLSMSLLSTKFLFQKYTVVLGWLTTLGYTSLDSKVEKTKDELLTGINIIGSSSTEDHARILDKDIRKIDKFRKLKQSDPKYFRSVLDFVNGTLRSEFGVSVMKKKGGKNATQPYILMNKYILPDNTPRFTATVSSNEAQYIPRLIKSNAGADMARSLNDPYDSDDASCSDEE